MTRRLSRIRKNIVVAPLIPVLLVAIACGTAANPTPAPEAVAPAPAEVQTPEVRIREIAVATEIPTAIPTPVAAAADSRAVALFDPNAKRGGDTPGSHGCGYGALRHDAVGYGLYRRAHEPAIQRGAAVQPSGRGQTRSSRTWLRTGQFRKTT